MHRKELAFILDIDGTVAFHEGVRGHYEYSKVSLDLPIWPVIQVAEQLSKIWQPVIVSGRMDEKSNPVRSDTVRWLRRYTKLCDFPLFMRSDGDYRKDYVIKEELYRKYIEPRWNIQVAIDDRLQVCQMWHRIGIPVLRAGDPDAIF